MKKILCLFLFILSSISLANPPEITLQQKIGQMIMLGFMGTELRATDPIVQDILAQRIGSVVLFTKDLQTKKIRNIENPQQLKQLTQQLQNYTQQAAKEQKNNLYPLLIGLDYEGGKVSRLNESAGFPKTIAAAEVAKMPLDQAETYAAQMAKTLQDAGVNLEFAPVLDVNVNPKNPIIGELGRSFSADPAQVTKYAQVFSQAFHDAGVLCSYKHFPGHGSSTSDSHLGFVDISKTWQHYELQPYKDLLNQPGSCALVMTGHLVNHQLDPKDYPGTLSAAMTTDLLRNKLNFQGVIITDDLQMKAIADHYDLATTLTMAINAGADILLFGNQMGNTVTAQQLIDIISQQVQAGKISKARIDEAYKRIVELKQKISKH